jgi:hypothetical protein
VVVVARGRVTAVDPIVRGRFWALVPQGSFGSVYAIP